MSGLCLRGTDLIADVHFRSLGYRTGRLLGRRRRSPAALSLCIVQTYCSLILSQRALLQEERSAIIIANHSWACGDSAKGIISVLALREALGFRLGDFEGVRKFRSWKNSTEVEKSSLAAQASPRKNKKEFEYPLQRSESFRTANIAAPTLPADHRFHGRLFLYFASCYGE